MAPILLDLVENWTVSKGVVAQRCHHPLHYELARRGSPECVVVYFGHALEQLVESQKVVLVEGQGALENQQPEWIHHGCEMRFDSLEVFACQWVSDIVLHQIVNGI